MATEPQSRKLTIMIAEDDVLDRTQMERLLKATSLPIGRCLYADSLRACLDEMKRQDVDIVLLDLNLTDSSGSQTVAEVHQQHPDVPIVVVTGEGLEGAGPKALAQGAQDYLVKGEFDARMLDKSVRYAVERKKQQEAMHLTQFSVDTASEAMFWVCENGSISYVNAAACRLLGYPREELLTKSVWDLNPAHAPSTWPDHWDDIRRRRSVVFEALLLTRDGRRTPVEISANYVEFGGHAYNCAFVRDITERRRTEERLLASEEKHRVLFENSRDALMILAVPSCRFASANQASLEMFGVPAEQEFLSLSPWDLSPERQPDGRPSPEKAKEMIETAMRTGSHYFEWTHKRLSGQDFPCTVLLTRMETGEETFVQSTVRDITEQKRAQEALQEGERRLTAILDSTYAAVVITDPETGMIVDFNPTAEMMLGISKDEVLGHAFQEFICHDPGNLHTRPERPQKVLRAEWVLKDAYGKRVQVLMNVVPITLQGNEFQIHSFLDITERKEAEEAIRQAYEKLDKANRELKEMQTQIVQSEKMASIGQLAAGIAHEMNTPVGFVACNFETLQKYMDKFLRLFRVYEQLGAAVAEGPKDHRMAMVEEIRRMREDLKIAFVLNDIKDLFEDSKEGLSRVTTIIQNLRDFSRIDQASDAGCYDINEGVRATLVVVQNEIKHEADIRLELGRIPAIPCRAGEINQVFLNILVNAAQAIRSQERSGRGAITIRTAVEGDYVVCHIADDGPGIAPENLRKIFDPFFTTKPAGKGTGLGLSISHDIIVNKHKGQLLVESELGHGAAFTIRLPINPAPAPQPEAAGALTGAN
jgi:two-component system, NtrC family, sensor kinase